MNLTEEQLNKRTLSLQRLKGRVAVIYNPYYCTFPNETKVIILNYIPEKSLFSVEHTQTGNREFCFRDEFNLIDKEFSDYRIIKKGIRNERKDKYGDEFIVELINNKRDIYLSSALVSLLDLQKEEKTYVGFATDPDTKNIYIFKADQVTGYEFNKNNNRITSNTDWRELNQFTGALAFNVKIQPIIDTVNNPDVIFYTLSPNYSLTYELKEQQYNKKNAVNQEKKNVVQKEEPSKGLYDRIFSGKIPVYGQTYLSDKTTGFINEAESTLKSSLYIDEDFPKFEKRIEEIKKSKQ